MKLLLVASCFVLLATSLSPAAGSVLGSAEKGITQQATGKHLPANSSSHQVSLWRQQLEKNPGNAPSPGSPMLPSGDCSDYVDLSAHELPIAVAGTTAGATNNYGPFPNKPECWEGRYFERWDPGAAMAPDVTYKWTAPDAGKYTISLLGSSYDTCLLLYDFTCPTEPVHPDDFICGSDDVIGIHAELFAMPFAAGQEILIVVDGYGNHAGPFQLSISRYERVPDLDAFIDDTMMSEHIPGLAACAIRDGEICWTRALGYSDIAHGDPVTDSTTFLMASISKTVTGVALMQLWEDGLFELDDDVDDYLPFDVNSFFYPDSAVTFRMLMAHTSGLNDHWNTLDTLTTWGGDCPIALGQFLEDYLTPGGAYYGLYNFNPWPPGQELDYSNVGAALAGYLAQRIADAAGRGSSLAAYCQDSLFAPLSMDETAWFLADLDSSNVAVPYRWAGSGHVRYPHYGVPHYPAGQLRTSALQLARFLIAFVQCGEIGDTRILDCPTVELMKTVQYPEFSPVFGLFWARLHFGGRWYWTHDGLSYGCRTVMGFCPEENSGMVVLTNGESSAHLMIAHEILEYVAATTSIPHTNDSRTIPQSVALHQNYPNPFNPVTTIPYDLSVAGEVTLRIYNIHGRLVRVLVGGRQHMAGRHAVRWDGRDDRGHDLASGAYWLRLESGSEQRVARAILIR